MNAPRTACKHLDTRTNDAIGSKNRFLGNLEAPEFFTGSP